MDQMEQRIKISIVASGLNPDLLGDAKSARSAADCLAATMYDKYKDERIFWTQAHADGYQTGHNTGTERITPEDRQALLEADKKSQQAFNTVQGNARRVLDTYHIPDEKINDYQTLSHAAAEEAIGLTDVKLCTVASNKHRGNSPGSYATLKRGDFGAGDQHAEPAAKKVAAAPPKATVTLGMNG